MRTHSTFKGMAIGAAILLQLSACMGQAQKKDPIGKAGDRALVADTPRVTVEVNRQYDENGNLIAFDSTYTSIYPGQAADPAFMDSVFRDFKGRSRTWYPFLNDPGFEDLFMQDSLRPADFFHDDYFRKRFDLNERYMERMMTRMDSVKNAFLRKQADGKTH